MKFHLNPFFDLFDINTCEYIEALVIAHGTE